MLKTRDYVLPTVTTWNQTELRVFRLTRFRVAGVRNEESAGSTQRELCMARETLVRVVTCTQAVRIRMELGKHRV